MHLIVKSLLERYQPPGMMSRVDLMKQLEKISMTKNEDPVILFVQLMSIETRYNTTLTLEQQLAKVLEVCPNKY